MAEKTLATRILNKYDSYTAWFNANPILKKGEISICEVPVETDQDNTVTQSSKPAILFKVGDGKTAWKSLPWATGLAGDVHGWAKAVEKPTYNASEIVNLEQFIGQNDTNTTYKLVQDADDGHKFSLQKHEKNEAEDTWTTITTITIPDNDHNQTVSAGSVTFGADDAVNFVAGTGIEIAGDAGAKTITVTAKKPTTAGTADKVAHKLTLQIEGSNEVTFDGSAAATFNVTAEKLGLSGAMHFLGVSTTAITDHGAEKPTIDGKPVTKLASGDVVIYEHLEFVWDGSKWEKLGDESSYALKTTTINNKPLSLGTITLTATDVGADAAGTAVDEIAKLDAALVGGKGKYIKSVEQVDGVIKAVEDTMPTALKNPNALTFTGAVTGEYDGSAAKTVHIPTQAEALSGVGNEDKAVEHQFVTAVKQTDGVVTVTRSAIAADDVSGLAAISKTGNVKDLVQTEGDILILDCGSATVNI